MNKDYLSKLNWVVFTMIDRSTQDDRKSKVSVSGAFNCPSNAEDFIKTLPAGHKWYILDFDRLERFEEFYNYVQDINEKYGEDAIFHINDGGFTVDELNCFRCKRVYDDKNYILHTYFVWYWEDDTQEFYTRMNNQNKIIDSYEVDYRKNEVNKIALEELRSGIVKPLEVKFN